MHNAHLSISADRDIRLAARNFGTPCLQVNEAPEYAACAPDCILSVHGAAPNTSLGMDLLVRAVEAFNAVMDGATLLPVHLARDAEHSASPAGRLAAEIEAGTPAVEAMTDCDPLKLANCELHREVAE